MALPLATATVDLVDFGYVVSEIKAGKQLIQANNKGAEDHEAMFFRIRDGKTIDDVRALLKLPEDQQDQQYAGLLADMGTLVVPAGQTTYAEQEFTAGRYALICFLPSASNGGKPHAELGMVQEVIVK